MLRSFFSTTFVLCGRMCAFPAALCSGGGIIEWADDDLLG